MAKVKYVKVVRPVETSCIVNPTDLKICNKRIIAHTAKMNKTTELQVADVLSFIGRYTRGVIMEGIMETVMLPYFGKFKPKVKELKARAMLMQGAQAGKHAIMKHIRKLKAIEEDETLRSGRKSQRKAK